MRRTTGWAVAVLLSTLAPRGTLPAQEAVHHPSAACSVDAVRSIPFKLTDQNNIVVQATLNGEHPVALMFHSAVDSMSLTRAAVDRIGVLAFDDEIPAKSWGGDATLRLSRGNVLTIGDLEWTDVSLTEDAHSGPQTDGKFGPNIFDNRVVELDFDERVLKIHPRLPAIDPSYQRFANEPGEPLFLEATVLIGDRKIPHRFLVHTGFGGTVLFDDQFARTNRLTERLPRTGERELTDSFGNKLKTIQCTVPSLRIGRGQLNDVPAELFEGALGNRRLSVVGGAILKRFSIIFDMNTGDLYLMPNRLFYTDNS